jgi:hypothetical protein
LGEGDGGGGGGLLIGEGGFADLVDI